MNWQQILKVCSTILLGLTSAIQAQVIARSDLPYFMGRLQYSGNWGDSIDISQFTEWRIDTLAQEEFHFIDGTAKSPDSGKVWAVMRIAGDPDASSRPIVQNPTGRFEFHLMTIVWGIQSLNMFPLTVWQFVSEDSIRLVCIDPVVSHSGVDKIRKVMHFPDSSILMFCGSFDWNHGSVTASDQFFRFDSACHFELLYESHWRNMVSTKTYVLANRLFEGRFRISEITEYLTTQDWRKTRVFSGGPDPAGETYDGTTLDSARIRVIDLWDLAREKSGKDTAKLVK